jgi:hypothetical protein
MSPSEELGRVLLPPELGGLLLAPDSEGVLLPPESEVGMASDLVGVLGPML